MRVVAEYDGIVTAHAQYSPRRGSRIIEGFQPIDGYREMLELEMCIRDSNIHKTKRRLASRLFHRINQYFAG